MTTRPNMAVQAGAGRIGTYAISTFAFDDVDTAPSKFAPSRKKGRGVREPPHPIFLECARLHTDPFWIEKLSQAAVGKFPPKFGCRGGLLLFKRGTKTESIELP